MAASPPAIVKEYQEACSSDSKTPNFGLSTSLAKFSSDGSEGLELEAPGNAPSSFHNRCDDGHLKIFFASTVLQSLIPKIQRVNLSYNGITDEGCVTIGNNLIANGTSLKTLKVLSKFEKLGFKIRLKNRVFLKNSVIKFLLINIP